MYLSVNYEGVQKFPSVGGLINEISENAESDNLEVEAGFDGERQEHQLLFYDPETVSPESVKPEGYVNLLDAEE